MRRILHSARELVMSLIAGARHSQDIIEMDLDQRLGKAHNTSREHVSKLNFVLIVLLNFDWEIIYHDASLQNKVSPITIAGCSNQRLSFCLLILIELLASGERAMESTFKTSWTSMR
jgi:hypothetical protein